MGIKINEICPFNSIVGSSVEMLACRAGSLRSMHVKDRKKQHRWFSGRMLACHAGGPGSIPGRCISVLFYSKLSTFQLKML